MLNSKQRAQLRSMASQMDTIMQIGKGGIGEKLIIELMDRLKENQVYALALEVRASNESAIALYDKLGFVQVGRRPNYYRKPTEDGLILKKEWEV